MAADATRGRGNQQPGAGVVGMAVDDVPTPALLVDLPRLERNLGRWQEAVTAGGTRFRPHVKTHKTPAIAVRQLELGACGITVAKVSEAEVFAGAAGARDIAIAFPLVGADKWDRAARLAGTGVRLAVNVDSDIGARGLSAAADAHGARIGVQLEVDTGLHRVGYATTETDRLESLARLVESLPGLELEGVTTHRGIFFAGGAGMTPAEAGVDEGTLLVGVADRLRARGIEIREVTAGGTFTGRDVATVPGVTEVRAGTYVFNDLMQLAGGSAAPDDIALTVLCTVVSHHDEWATIDGGSKTFSGDVRLSEGLYARAFEQPAGVGRLSEEHGVVTQGAAEVALGEKVAWVPAHVCTCVNLADELLGVRNGRVEVVWPIEARGMRT